MLRSKIESLMRHCTFSWKAKASCMHARSFCATLRLRFKSPLSPARGSDNRYIADHARNSSRHLRQNQAVRYRECASLRRVNCHVFSPSLLFMHTWTTSCWRTLVCSCVHACVRLDVKKNPWNARYRYTSHQWTWKPRS